MKKKKRPRHTINFDTNTNFLLKKLGYTNAYNQIIPGRNLSGLVCSLIRDWVREELPNVAKDMDRMRLLARIKELQEIKGSVEQKLKLCAMELNNRVEQDLP